MNRNPKTVDLGDNKGNLRKNLEQNGATAEEIHYLLDLDDPDTRTGRRVELNALTSRQFIDLLERKLIANGVEKVVPDRETLQATFRLFEQSRLIKPQLASLIAATADGIIEVPDDLEVQIHALLEKEPALAWEAAVRKIVETTNLTNLSGEDQPKKTWPDSVL